MSDHESKKPGRRFYTSGIGGYSFASALWRESVRLGHALLKPKILAAVAFLSFVGTITGLYSFYSEQSAPSAKDDTVSNLAAELSELRREINTGLLNGGSEFAPQLIAASQSRILYDVLSDSRPVAVVQISELLYLSDKFGRVIEPIDVHEYSNLPLVVGATSTDFRDFFAIRDFLDQHKEFAAQIAVFVRVGGRRWNIRLKDGSDIRLPERRTIEALIFLVEADKQAGLLGQQLEYIDLRDDEAVALRPRFDGANEGVEVTFSREHFLEDYVALNE